MDSYFLREGDVADVDRRDLRGIWERDRIAIHYPGDGPVDLQSLNPGDYRTRAEKNAVRTFARIAREGGYVWCQCPGEGFELVGKVKAGTKVELVDTRWRRARAPSDAVAPRRPGDPAVLKVLPLEVAKRVGPDELIGLRAARPRKAGLSEWQACGKRLEAFVEEKILTIEWRELSSELRETAASEFLRHHELEDVPRMRFLLMPVGRTLQEIDIYGMTDEGKDLYAQVGQGKPDFLEGTGKVGALLEVRRRDKEAELVMFCDVPEVATRDGVWLVPNKEVFEFLWRNPEYLHRLFLF